MKVTVTLKDGTTGSIDIDLHEVESLPPDAFEIFLAAGANITRDLGYFLTMGVSPQLWHLMGSKTLPGETE